MGGSILLAHPRPRTAERGTAQEWENVLKAELSDRFARQGQAIAAQLAAVKAEIEAFLRRYVEGDCGC